MRDSRLEEAKFRADIPMLWAYYGYPEEPGKSCRSPFREDRNPSFSVSGDGQRWKDFGTGEGGDPIDFIAMAEGIENAEACRRILDIAGLTPSEHRKSRAPKPRSIRRDPKKGKPDPASHKNAEPLPIAQRLRVGKPAELQALLQLRGFPQLARSGLELLQERGMLRFLDQPDGLYWVVTDSTHRNIQIRRMDGKPIPVGERTVKAKTWPGSQAGWPLGLEEVSHREKIILVEGGPDLLAATALVAEDFSEATDPWGFLTVLGAGQIPPREQLAVLKHKQLTLVEHADRAGKKLCQRWRDALIELGNLDVMTIRFPKPASYEDPGAEDLAEAISTEVQMPLGWWDRLRKTLGREQL